MEINRLNYLKKEIPKRLFYVVNRWFFYNSDEMNRVKKGVTKYVVNFEKMFVDLGFKKVMINGDSERWWMVMRIMEGLGFPENVENMVEIINSRILCICRVIRNDMFVKDANVVEPELIDLGDRRWKINYLNPTSNEVDLSGMKKYESIVDSIKQIQNSGKSCLDYQINMSPLERLEVKREVLKRVFVNEFEIFMVLMEINRLNYLKKVIPKELVIASKTLNSCVNNRNYLKVMKGKLVYGSDFKRLFIDLGIKDYLVSNNPKRWNVLVRMIEGLKFPENQRNMMEIINSRVLYFVGRLKDDLFDVSFRYSFPYFLAAEKRRRDYFYRSKSRERKVELEDSLMKLNFDGGRVVDVRDKNVYGTNESWFKLEFILFLVGITAFITFIIFVI